MEIALLGPVRAWSARGAVALGLRQRRFVLAMLALEADRLVPVDRLIALTWPEGAPPAARHNIQTHISGLRSALRAVDDGVQVVRQGSAYRLCVDPAQVDAHRFRALTERARGSRDDETRVTLLRQALDLWHGPALADAASDDVRRDLCGGLEDARLAALEDRLDAELRLGRHAALVTELADLCARHPLRQRLAGQLMLALYRCGDPAEALRAFRVTRQRYAEDLGLDIGDDLRHLELAILRGDPTLRAPTTAADAGSAPDAAHADRDHGSETDPDRPRRGGSAAGPAVEPPPRRPRSAPAQLPAGIADFTGRDAELSRMRALLPPDPAAPEAGAPAGVVVIAVVGTAGVGKTALVTHFAHQITHRFPDGQLHANLRGYAGGAPATAEQVLARFLAALDVPADQIPLDPERQAALYRSLVADRRMLVVLDNAADAAQVRPLLPGGPHCLVLVTSRDRLSGLVASHGARRLALTALTPGDARQLLARTLGDSLTGADPEVAAELARQCAHLPLALRIAAANLADDPHRTVADYLAEFTGLARSERLNRLEVDGDSDTAVRTAFAHSYRALPVPARRMFRLLGLVPGPDITVPAAAALAGVDHDRAARLMKRLAAAHLVEQHAPGRYACHDLLRLYAGERADAEDDPGRREAAVAALLRWYLAGADRAAGTLYPNRLRLPADQPGPGVGPAFAPADTDAASRWLDAERANLVAGVEHAAEHGPKRLALRLSDALRGYFALRRNTTDWFTVSQAGLAAAIAEGDPVGTAAAYQALAHAHSSLGENDRAIDLLTRALELTRRTDWRAGQSSTLNNLAMLHGNSGRLDLAVDCYEQALAISRQDGDQASVGLQLNNIGSLYHRLGRLDRAADTLVESLAMIGACLPDTEQASSLHNLGAVDLDSGRLDRAERHLERSLALHRQVGDRSGQVNDLFRLSTVYRWRGDRGRALDLADTAVALADEIAMPAHQAAARIARADARLSGARPGRAVTDYQSGADLAGQAGSRFWQARALAGLATAHRLLGAGCQAAECAERALSLVRSAGFGLLEPSALLALAALAVEQGEPERAADLSWQALAVAERNGQRLDQGRALRLLGHARDQSGDPVGAAAHWRAALTLFTRAGATGEAEHIRELRAGRRTALTG